MCDGEFDILILTPPCASWTRALFSGKPGPAPCRDADHPWGFPNALKHIRDRARMGNEFVHFTLRLAEAAQAASSRGTTTTRVLIEHPEDLGATPRGKPASIWQLPEMRALVKKGSSRALYQIGRVP